GVCGFFGSCPRNVSGAIKTAAKIIRQTDRMLCRSSNRNSAEHKNLFWISLLRLNNADVMVSKLEVRRRRAKLWHVTGNTILGGDLAGNSQTLRSLFSFHLGRLLFSRVAGEALLIVKSYVLAQRLVGIVAGRAGYAAIIRVTLAVEDAVRLKADI